MPSYTLIDHLKNVQNICWQYSVKLTRIFTPAVVGLLLLSGLVSSGNRSDMKDLQSIVIHMGDYIVANISHFALLHQLYYIFKQHISIAITEID